MRTSSAKAKGRRLQQLTRDLIIESLSIPAKDVESRSMGAPGIDVSLSQEARLKFPFGVECKNSERLNLWAAWRQCQENAIKEDLIPLMVVGRNRQEPLAVVPLKIFMEMVKEINSAKSANST